MEIKLSNFGNGHFPYYNENMHKNWIKNKNSVYLSNMRNFGILIPSQNKIVNLLMEQ